MTPPEDPNRVTTLMNIRVADIATVYREWQERGAQFLTEPLDNHGAEQSCYLRDPDGYLIELGASTPRAVPGLTRAAVTASNRRRRPPVLVRDPARRIVAYVSRPGCYWAQG